MASDGAVPVEKEWQQIEEEPVVEIRYPGLRDLLCHVLKHCKLVQIHMQTRVQT